jgi:endonuclease/exonuclease/phosphatase family metal-dependent hydrolase
MFHFTCLQQRAFFGIGRSFLVLALLTCAIPYGRASALPECQQAFGAGRSGHALASEAPPLQAAALTIDLGHQPQEPSGKKLALQLTKIREAKGLRVFWWNVARGELSGDGSLLKNLQALAQSDLSPDIIALGEVSRDMVVHELEKQIGQSYSHSEFLPYNRFSPNLGIYVLSRYPLKLNAQKTLGWIPEELSPTERADYLTKWRSPSADDPFYLRTVSDLRVDYLGTEISLVPVHLAQPWRQIRETSSNRATAMIDTLKEIFFGTSNPLFTQIKELQTWLHQQSSSARVVFGDFNTPTGFLGFPTRGFRELMSEMHESLARSAISFPTPSSPLKSQYPSVQIDHAFVEGDVNATSAEVLPLKGSDHFPVYGVFSKSVNNEERASGF